MTLCFLCVSFMSRIKNGNGYQSHAFTNHWLLFIKKSKHVHVTKIGNTAYKKKKRERSSISVLYILEPRKLTHLQLAKELIAPSIFGSLKSVHPGFS